MPLSLRQVRTNNLKGFDLELETTGITVICGVSGSGKSSLVFDTIHAEGQRRYLETFSPQVRERLARLPRPDAERLDGVPPTIALPQDGDAGGLRETLGESIELIDLYAEVYAAAAAYACPECGQPLAASDPESLADEIGIREPGTRLVIAFPIAGEPRDAWPLLRDARFVRAVVDGTLHRLDEPPPSGREVLGVVDRVVAGRTERARLIESATLALRAGRDRIVLLEQDADLWHGPLRSRQLSCSQGHLHCDRPTADDFRRLNTLTPLLESAEVAGCSFARRLAGDRSPLPSDERLSANVLAEIRERHAALHRVGLGGQPLRRPLAALSAGDRQRLRLAALLVARSVGSLIILDEPTSGLPPHAAAQVLAVVQELATGGNGILLVEHRLESLAIADRVLELGPSAGADGGEIVFDGTPAEHRGAATATAESLRRVPQPRPTERQGPPLAVALPGGSALPLERDRFTVLVSESASLGSDVLVAIAGKRDRPATHGREAMREAEAASDESDDPADEQGEPAGPPLEGIEDVIVVDQSPASQSARSCVATATKVMDEVRPLFAAVPDARARGLTPRHFSFNAPGSGRCPYCQGRGEVSVAMAHYADLPMTCPRCGGARFAADVLDIKHRRRSIADVLAMTVDEALVFFRTELSIHRRLQTLRDVGLGYLTLGRSLPSLSGGESQRLRLASHLTTSTRGRVLFLLDAPARGLHPRDAETLADTLRRLLEIGHTVLAADSSYALLAAADRVLDLEPDAIAFSGSPSAYLETDRPTATAWREAIAVGETIERTMPTPRAAGGTPQSR